jgi:hypothetical protein
MKSLPPLEKEEKWYRLTKTLAVLRPLSAVLACCTMDAA